MWLPRPRFLKVSEKYDPMTTEIPTTRDSERLSISLDEEEGPTFLYVPNTAKFDHDHISLTEEGAKALFEWLKEYLRG